MLPNASVVSYLERELSSDLSLATTLALPCTAAATVNLENEDQLTQLSQWHHHQEFRKVFVLGGGSNTVAAPFFDGLIIHMALQGRRILRQDSDFIYIEAAAGENWNDFVSWTLAENSPGLENLIAIPGQVGAAPIQNIGAYGREVAQFIDHLLVWDVAASRFITLSAQDCEFSYRHSIFKRLNWSLNASHIVCRVAFRLPRRWQAHIAYADLERALAEEQNTSGCTTTTPDALCIAKTVTKVRQRKLPNPVKQPNAGSFFQNPVVTRHHGEQLKQQYPSLPLWQQDSGDYKLPAAWLIERSGWKGRPLGPVMMSEKQALVLINHGGALRKDIEALVRCIQESVVKQFNVHLIPEPVWMP